MVYHPIRPATPRHNGKVERSHREDQKRFYDKAAFYSLEDASSQIEKYLINQITDLLDLLVIYHLFRVSYQYAHCVIHH
ncbi:MAG: integrase core domain-containing protein [Longicatena caecimuris]|uniref:integrase core domain-containing protein n=1 Tax=Longicatena caecimuris TaxID=1796635 RepID=UPI0039917ED7